MGTRLHLAAALHTTGEEAFTARHWAGLVREAEEAKLDFVTFDDSLGGRPGLDAADGFILVPHVTPGGLDEFADTVVPLLQERGVFRADYTGPTLRDHLGIR